MSDTEPKPRTLDKIIESKAEGTYETTRNIYQYSNSLNFPTRDKFINYILDLEKQNLMVDKIQQAHDKWAVAGFVEALPLKNESIDVALDNYCRLFYTESPQSLTKAYAEILRVLKHKGKIRANLNLTRYFGMKTPLSWQEKVFEELGKIYPIKYTRICNLDKPKRCEGFEITKL